MSDFQKTIDEALANMRETGADIAVFPLPTGQVTLCLPKPINVLVLDPEAALSLAKALVASLATATPPKENLH